MKLSKSNILRNQHYYFQVFFERNNELIKSDKRYRFVIFNHVGIYIPYFASIFEVTSTGIGIAQQSSDRYLPENYVKIILPIWMPENKQIKPIIEKHLHRQYSYCVPYVVNVLKEINILKKSFDPSGVDELFLALTKYKLNVEIVKKFYEKE